VTQTLLLATFPPVQKLLLLSLLCFPLATYATESIELTNGTKVEGKILSVDSQSVVMEVSPSPAIIEEKTFPRDQVAKINRPRPDDLAFDRLSKAGIPNTADSPEVYGKFLESQVQPFMKDFAYSKHMPAVRKMAAEVEAEQERVRAGEVKIEGEWIAAGADTSSDAEVRGRLQLVTMKQSSQPWSGLRAFETLEKESRNSSAYPEAIRLAQGQLSDFMGLITQTRTQAERREKELAEGLQLASIDRRNIMQQGIDEERSAIKSRIEAAKKSGSKWQEPLPDLAYLTALEKQTRTESDRLAKIDLTKMDAAIAVARRAKEEIESGDLVAAEASLGEAQKLWSQHVLLASLKESLKKAQEEAARAAKEQQKPSES